MSEHESQSFENIADAVLCRWEFRRKRLYWRRSLEDLVQIVNLQKSAHSAVYYVNVGVCLKSLAATNAEPKYKDMHLFSRIEYFVDDELKRLWDIQQGFPFLLTSAKDAKSVRMILEQDSQISSSALRQCRRCGALWKQVCSPPHLQRQTFRNIWQ